MYVQQSSDYLEVLKQLRFTSIKLVYTWIRYDNDPSAGSPTETLLRLLLPLNDQV